MSDVAPDTGDRVMIVRRNADGVGDMGSVPVTDLFDDAGVGYSDGIRGTVTQITSITTDVTVNALHGQITTVSQTVAAAGEADFVVSNSEVAANDMVVVAIKDHTSAGTFQVGVADISTGAFTIRLANLHASAAGDNVLVLSFMVFKGTQ